MGSTSINDRFATARCFFGLVLVFFGINDLLHDLRINAELVPALIVLAVGVVFLLSSQGSEIWRRRLRQGGYAGLALFALVWLITLRWPL
jgi:hypothetical protein